MSISIVIDAVLVLIVLFCIWRGFKNGLIRGVCGIIALIISIFVANLVATAYSSDFSGMLNPFISGVVDTALDNTITSGDYGSGILGGAGSPANGNTSGQGSQTGNNIYDITSATLQKLGLPSKPTELISQQVGSEVNTIGRELSGNITEKLSDALAYAAVFIICFILLEIIFAVIGNLANLIFSLPGLEGVDKIAGSILGLAKGVIIVLVIALALRYLGLISAKTIDGTHILKLLINHNPIANILGI